MNPKPEPERRFTLCLETWPQADLRLKSQRPLAVARQDITVRLAQSALGAGALPVFLTDTEAAASRIRLSARDLEGAVIADAASDGWTELIPRGSAALRVRWGSGILLNSQVMLTLAGTACDGRMWGNRAPNADILARLSPPAPDVTQPPDALFPPSAATLARLMTGGDLALFAAHTPELLSDESAELPDEAITEGIRKVTRLIAQRSAELVVVGDPGASAWRHLERETACRVRLLADPPQGVLASLLQASGSMRFARYLSELGDAAVINTRILFFADDYPSSDDFFWSDLGKVERVSHSGLRALTGTLLQSDQAVVLGGDSLMHGGMLVLTERAWSERDLPRQVDILDVQIK